MTRIFANGKRKICVVSAVNFTEGGPLTILKECLVGFAETLNQEEWEIVAIVNNKDLINVAGVTYVEIPAAKRSWLYRLYYEYIGFYRISKKMNVDLWLSLHDVTPNVRASRQVVYCHNPAPFYKLSLREAWFDPKFLIFNYFYAAIYGFNIRRNDYVIVQQSWIRQLFLKKYRVKNVIVAHPDARIISESVGDCEKSEPYTFIFPALPRVFKNFEVICEASRTLCDRGVRNFKVVFTIDGTENRYAKWIVNKFRSVPCLAFLGRQSSSEMAVLYRSADCVIFPSKLETWGLPITEAKSFGKPILLANLPYAHETVGGYARVSFFDPIDAAALADLMAAQMTGEARHRYHEELVPTPPFVRTWKDLLAILVGIPSCANS